MKNILRILVILIVSALVSGALYLTVENTSIFSDMDRNPEDGSEFIEQAEKPTGEMDEPPTRSRGGDDHLAASLARGLSEVLVSLAKVAGITVIVLLVQAVLSRQPRRKPDRSMAG